MECAQSSGAHDDILQPAMESGRDGVRYAKEKLLEGRQGRLV